MPEVRPVTKDNWRALVKLQVREDQKNFVATNVYSIAESQFGFDDDVGHWDMFSRGIYEGDAPVGFLMYAFNYDDPKMQGFIVRLMVDEKFQGKGYGRFGVEWMIEQFRADERVRAVGISYEPENDVARKLYASCGFVETGEMMGEEVLALLKIR
jgi:diamine N-acetyltransferase